MLRQTCIASVNIKLLLEWMHIIGIKTQIKDYAMTLKERQKVWNRYEISKDK